MRDNSPSHSLLQFQVHTFSAMRAPIDRAVVLVFPAVVDRAVRLHVEVGDLLRDVRLERRVAPRHDTVAHKSDQLPRAARLRAVRQLHVRDLDVAVWRHTRKVLPETSGDDPGRTRTKIGRCRSTPRPGRPGSEYPPPQARATPARRPECVDDTKQNLPQAGLGRHSSRKSAGSRRREGRVRTVVCHPAAGGGMLELQSDHRLFENLNTSILVVTS